MNIEAAIMTYDQTQTLAQFLDAAAAKQPTPGGGSASALVGALAAAMGEMVMNYSVGRKSTAVHDAELREVLTEMHRARQLMLALMVEDQAAYEALAETRQLSPDSAQWKEKFPVALLACIRVPQAIAAAAVAILDLCQRISAISNPHLLSDLLVCADLAMAATRCAMYNVRANARELPDAAERESVETAAMQVLKHAIALIQSVVPQIRQRDNQRSTSRGA
jgi:formiminotetrahydrofolate cyclodeaminase